jgi:hypothetical protein
MLAAAATLAAATLVPCVASAGSLFDFFFGGAQKRQTSSQANFFADPFGLNQQPASPPPQRAVASGNGPAFCVRSCDGKYFALARGTATPVQMCQAFCPASLTKVFFGSTIDNATSATGERYAESENAFAFRKALRADCTCNGRDPTGLAPVDLTLDSTLRSGDVIATTEGLVAYSGVRTPSGQTAEFTPIASYPGLTSEVRARLGEMKVAPVAADVAESETPIPDVGREKALPGSLAPKAISPREKRAQVGLSTQ